VYFQCSCAVVTALLVLYISPKEREGERVEENTKENNWKYRF
jgi:hypothetical protein